MKNKIASIIFVFAIALLSSCSMMPTVPFLKNNTPPLSVSLQDGQVLTPAKGLLQNFSPITFTIPYGKCQQVLLTIVNQTETVPLQVCYRENTFYLDTEVAAFMQTKKAIRFNYIPLWQQGFTYRGISTNGPAHLSGTTVSITISR